MADNNAQMKKCPMCAEMIPLEAQVCDFCDARFLIGRDGYCPNCHAMRDAGADGTCTVCGTKLEDLRVKSVPLEEFPPQPVTVAEMPVARQVPAAQPAPQYAPMRRSASCWSVGLILVGVAAATLGIFSVTGQGPKIMALLRTATPTATITFTPSLTPTHTPTRTPTPNRTRTQQALLDRQATETALSMLELLAESRSWHLEYEEGYASNGLGYWDEGSSDLSCISGSKSFSGGKYRWQADATGSCIWVSWPPLTGVQDFALSVECGVVSGAETAQCGLAYRLNANTDYYYITMSNDGYIRAKLLLGDTWETLIPKTSAAAIQQGGSNQLTVIARGDHFMFFINGQFVADVTNGALGGKGKVGLAILLGEAGDRAVFEFDNFELRTP